MIWKSEVLLKKINPKLIKEDLGIELVTRYYDKESAVLAREEFNNVSKQGKLPSDIKTFELEGPIWIAKVLLLCGLEKSTSQGVRDIEANAVSINSEKVKDRKFNLTEGEYILQVGKRRFAKVIISGWYTIYLDQR